MSGLAASLAALPTILQLVMMIVKSIQKTPAEKRSEFIDALNGAMSKAKNEKDPSDLSRLINSKL